MADSAEDAGVPVEAAHSEEMQGKASAIRVEKLTEDGGLIKEVTLEGYGGAPNAGDEVVAHYTGRLMDGTIFDSSIERGQTFKFVLGQGQVIKGWDLGFASMKQGEKAVLQCAPDYAYGARGSPPKIPANATLRFEVELIGFGPKKKQSWEMNNNEKVLEAERCKNEGNACFTSGDLRGALEEYKEGWRAIEYLKENSATTTDPLSEESKALLKNLQVTLNSNMAMVNLKLQAWPEAVKSATTALSHDSTHAKSLFRRGTARAHMGMVEDAKADLLAAAKIAPGDAGIKAELDRVNKLVAAAREREKKAFGGIFNRKDFSLEEKQVAAPVEAAATVAEQA